MLLKREIVPALPRLGQVHGRSWFNEQFQRIGREGAQEFGTDWLVVNTWIQDAVAGAGVTTSNPVIRWLCYVIARGICQHLNPEEIG